MISGLKELFHKFTTFMYGDMETPDNELEKVIFNRNETDDEYSASNASLAGKSESLYIQPEEFPSEDIETCQIHIDIMDERLNRKDDGDVEDLHASECDYICDTVSQSSDIDSFLTDLANVISEMDIVKEKLTLTESQEIIRFCQERILECMTKYSSEVLGDETTFNSEIHVQYPFCIVPNGTHIKNCLRKGLKKNGVTLIKAIVEI